MKDMPINCGPRCNSTRRLLTIGPITAVTYADGVPVSTILQRVAALLAAEGVRCCGFIQHDVPSADRRRCDMVIENLASRERLKISEDRGPGARGCRLDEGELVRAVARAREQLREAPDLLIVNKFGKSEAEGGGFRSLIADAFDCEVPVLIAVPWRNIESWRAFAGELAIEFDAEVLLAVDDAKLLQRLGVTIEASGRTCAVGPWADARRF